MPGGELLNGESTRHSAAHVYTTTKAAAITEEERNKENRKSSHPETLPPPVIIRRILSALAFLTRRVNRIFISREHETFWSSRHNYYLVLITSFTYAGNGESMKRNSRGRVIMAHLLAFVRRCR